MSVGYWEQAVFTRDGVTVGGWAYDKDAQTPPTHVVFEFAGRIEQVPCLLVRPDVDRALQADCRTCGFKAEVKLRPSDFPVGEALKQPSITAVWADKRTLLLRPAALAASNQFLMLNFSTKEEFTKYFQNPAFRIANKNAINWASYRFIDGITDDVNAFMSAYCVAIYRHLEGRLSSTDSIDKLHARWDLIKAKLPFSTIGEQMRWVISTKLARGYLFLVEGKTAAAHAEFHDIVSNKDRIHTWPQASTNILIGVFMSAWLDFGKGRTDAAIGTLNDHYDIFIKGVSHLRPWSRHHYSELENALRLSGECFVLLSLLKGEKRPHIVPPKNRLSLGNISAVLSDLLASNLLVDGPFPDPSTPA